jgi:hypothetical protein
MTAGLSHQGTTTQRGTKACASTEVFVFLRVLVPWWHLLSFLVFHAAVSARVTALKKRIKQVRMLVKKMGPDRSISSN